MKNSTILGIAFLAFLLVGGVWFFGNEWHVQLRPGEKILDRGNMPEEPILITEEERRFDLAGGPERENRGFPQREIIDLAAEYPEVFVRKAPRGEKKVALTFDDGPDDLYTVQILDILKEYEVPATFFIVGRRTEILPEVVTRMDDEGHRVANHTWSHPDLLKLTPEEIIVEIEKTERLVERLVGYKPILFRAPYGSIDREKVELLVGKGYLIISWDVDSLDWKGLSAQEVKTNVLENVEEGSIILQHSAGGIGEDLSGTVEALPDIIRVLQKDGYEFLTIDELLNIPFKRNG